MKHKTGAFSLKSAETREGQGKGSLSKGADKVSTSKPKLTQRRLSPHVYTRCYRPPEIILSSNDYDFSADIWAAGCTIAETIRRTDAYSNCKSHVLFKGKSCHPLSPAASSTSPSNREDAPSSTSKQPKYDTNTIRKDD